MLIQEAQRNLLNGRCWGLRRCRPLDDPHFVVCCVVCALHGESPWDVGTGGRASCRVVK